MGAALSCDTCVPEHIPCPDVYLCTACDTTRVIASFAARRTLCSPVPPTYRLPYPRTNPKGFLSGYVASSFTFGRFLSGYFWGAISDRFGRNPVIIIGLLSIATFSMIFGCSTSYEMALISR